MKRSFYCVDCIERIAECDIHDISAKLFGHLCGELGFEAEVCPACGSSNVKQILGMTTSYISGYGFADKRGVKRDMDMHAMATGNDPYIEHRKNGEKRDVMLRLQRDREKSKNAKTVRLTNK